MGASDKLKQELKGIVIEAMAEAGSLHRCQVFDKDDVESLRMAVGTIHRLYSDGGIVAYFEDVYDNHKYLKNLRERNKKIRDYALIAATGLLVSSLGLALWTGATHLLHAAPTPITQSAKVTP